MSIAEKLTTVAENQQKVYDAGKKAEYDRFWDVYQQNGNRNNYLGAFAGVGWTDDNYNPKYPIVVTGDGQRCFQSNINITSTKVPIVVDTATESPMFFNYAYNLLEIPSLKITAKVPSLSSWFSGLTKLKTLNITEDSVIAANINISVCSQLTHDSLMSVINALQTKTSGTFTCTLGASNLAKLGDAEKAIATEKGWTLA